MRSIGTFNQIERRKTVNQKIQELPSHIELGSNAMFVSDKQDKQKREEKRYKKKEKKQRKSAYSMFYR